MEKTIEIPEGYEAALERCKQWVAGTSGLNPGASPKEVSEYIFPELAESEDEKIRKELIQYHTDGMKDSPWFTQTLRHKDVLAYLERQKEQKPVEWSEEDEKNLKLAYDLLVNGVEADRRYPELISWLKSLPKRLHLQPKQGWSETDKQMLENIIEVIGETCPGNYTASFITKMLSWLKSLRPQPHWKPSEKQIEALRVAAYEPYKNWHKLLQELYTDLKKL